MARVGGDAGDIAESLEVHRAELTRHCARLLRSPGETEDAVQETFIRAWRARSRFEGRGTLRSWLYTIATNVCLDELARRRAHPIEVRRSAVEFTPSRPRRWFAASGARGHGATDPADAVVSRDDVRHAMEATFRQLPPRQRAALLLCDVLRWRAKDVAELLGVTVPSVNSALQRARATLAARRAGSDELEHPDGIRHRRVSDLVDAFVRYDFDELAAVLRDDDRAVDGGQARSAR